MLLQAQLAFARDPRLAIIDVDGNTSNESTDIHYFVQKGVRLSESKATEVALDDVLNAGAYATDVQNVEFGRTELRAGLAEYSEGRCNKAIDRFDQAITMFERSFAFVEDSDDYLKALLNQSACLAETGNLEAARLMLTKALVLEPKLEPSLYPGDRTLFDSAHRALRDKELSSITVSTEPQGGRVFVDGRFRGVAPAIRPGLRQGVHFVRVERQGYGRIGKTVRTGGADSRDVRLDLKQTAVRKQAVLTGLLPGLKDDFGKAELEPGSAVSRLGGVLLVDYAVLFRTSGPASEREVVLTLYDIKRGKLLKQVRGTVDWAARDRAAKNAVLGLAKDLMDVQLEQSIAVAPVAPVGGDEGTEDGGVATKWWFWTIIGAVAVGTAVGLAVGLQPEDDAPAGLDKDGNGALILNF